MKLLVYLQLTRSPSKRPLTDSYSASMCGYYSTLVAAGAFVAFPDIALVSLNGQSGMETVLKMLYGKLKLREGVLGVER